MLILGPLRMDLIEFNLIQIYPGNISTGKIGVKDTQILSDNMTHII